MKSETLRTVRNYMRKAFTAAMVVCVLMATSFPLSANAQALSSESTNPEIKYLGIVEGKLVFQIDLPTVSENNPYVSIRDEEGTILFAERIRDNKFSRKFAFEKEEFEGKKLSFVIYNGKESTTQAFQVARNTRVIEDVVITRL